MPKRCYIHKAVHKIGLYSTCDGYLITGDHQILIGCNIFYGQPEHPVVTQVQLIK